MSKFNNGDITDVIDSFFIDYAIDEDDDEANVQELMQQLSDMSEAVNEWYVKSKAFDFIREARKEVLTDVRERGVKLPADLDKFSMMTERIINKYESGGYDA